ncbi:kinase domain protein (macronuclear) [Tetrahymena thermophila SB210]|uniref:Kinase domain protein n=1 Tax=Tetrahymena thermophila (strain SB210) TaxID=312017 RepID=W7XJ20_TETTS|nr:kinase domain protein [Tetrahymena thermophila SB210]EWS75131.1 kinase domain protein [Tetrahymena thermophila SB210]|eukprot:XP_012652369.1 kinase domain protein [Tetrahymena thermophila SB210]
MKQILSLGIGKSKGIDGAKKLGQDILRNTKIEDLQLEISEGNFVGMQGIKEIGKSLLQCKEIKKYSLEIQDKNQLQSYSSLCIFYLLSSIPTLDKLQEIKIIVQSKELQQNEFLEVSQALKKCVVLRSLTLILGNQMHIDDNPLQQIIETVSQLSFLKEFTIEILNDNQYSKKVCYYLENALNSCSKITNLSISFGIGNYIENEGLKQLSRGLEKLGILKKLYLRIGQENQIDHVGIKFFAESLSKCYHLILLDLTIVRNEIGSEGAKYLGQGLKFCRHLQRLYLTIGNGCNIGVDGMEGIGNGLKNLKHLNFLDLIIGIQNKVEKLGIIKLAKRLNKCQKLMIVYFLFRLSPDSQLFIDIMHKSKRLTYIKNQS